MKKILIYGLGNVGRNLAFYLAFDNEYEIGLISRSESKCRALILDLLPISNNVVDAGSIDLSSYDFLFVTAGISDEKNRVNFIINSKKMINDILLDVKSRGFSGNVIIISNPTDVLATYAYQKYHNDFKNILSTGTIIDSLRLKMIIDEDVKLYGLHGNDCLSYFVDVDESSLQKAKDIGYEIQKLGFNSSFGICLAAKKLMMYLDGNYKDSFVASSYNDLYNVSFSHDLVLVDGVVTSLLIDENNKNYPKLKEYILRLLKEVEV